MAGIVQGPLWSHASSQRTLQWVPPTIAPGAWFTRSRLIEPDDMREMLGCEDSAFSLDAAGHIAANDRAESERLRPYGNRPLNVRFSQLGRRSWSRRRCLFLADSCRSSNWTPEAGVDPLRK